MVCRACKGVNHNGQPTDCQGGTWCDCLHRPVVVRSAPELVEAVIDVGHSDNGVEKS